uniref:Uncharacterized protein n=1 Tax=Knipowitschia caucasica TaxID=637954 RepID=A0AAV2JAK0_KNICA
MLSRPDPSPDNMNKLCLVFLGVFLIALHLTSQAQAQARNTTMAPMAANTTMLHHNTTGNSTQDKSSGGRTEGSVLLLALALGLLHGWF